MKVEEEKKRKRTEKKDKALLHMSQTTNGQDPVAEP
jgi:hypothetical protein